MDSVRLIQFTDTHLFGDAHATLRGIATRATLRQTLQHAREHIAAADAVLVTGDLVQDDAGGYQPFREAFGALGKPVLTLPGNHDDIATMRAALQHEPFQYGGYRDIGGWRIVMVDSVIPGEAAGHVGAAALQSLRDALGGAAHRHVLVCLHHHPLPMRSRWLDTVGIDNPQEFFAALDANSAVRAVLWGHVHQAYDGKRHSVRLLATPSTCAQFLPLSDEFAIDAKPPAYRILELTADGAVNTEVLWLTRE